MIFSMIYFNGGYFDLTDILEDSGDINRVNEAMNIICEFKLSCEDQIKDLYM